MYPRIEFEPPLPLRRASIRDSIRDLLGVLPLLAIPILPLTFAHDASAVGARDAVHHGRGRKRNPGRRRHRRELCRARPVSS